MGANASSRPDKGAGVPWEWKTEGDPIYLYTWSYLCSYFRWELYMTVRCQGVGMSYSVQPIYKNPIAPASRQVLHSYSIQYV